MDLLDKTNYPKVIEALEPVTINHLFARAVVEHHISGKVYVDDRENPSTFYIVHPYGMSLLLGKNDNEDFNEAFKEYALNTNGNRQAYEWMQAFPNGWHSTLKKLLADCLVHPSENEHPFPSNLIALHTRVNFKFNPKAYAAFKNKLEGIVGAVIETTQKEYATMEGAVVPSKFWNGAADFLANGMGYSTYVDNTLACTAFSAFLIDDKLELGMETVPKFRGRGLAQYTCSRLIDYCLQKNYTPVWACRLENTGSLQLAQKLGFEPTIQLPYYRLSN
ncbi:MAG: GNAT family N-acetyltransferase [Thermonemataceae bacterium]